MRDGRVRRAIGAIQQRGQEGRRIEESKKKTTRCVCGQTGHWAGDHEYTEEKKAPTQCKKGFGRPSGAAGVIEKSKGRGKPISRFSSRTKTSYILCGT